MKTSMNETANETAKHTPGQGPTEKEVALNGGLCIAEYTVGRWIVEDIRTRQRMRASETWPNPEAAWSVAAQIARNRARAAILFSAKASGRGRP